MSGKSRASPLRENRDEMDPLPYRSPQEITAIRYNDRITSNKSNIWDYKKKLPTAYLQLN